MRALDVDNGRRSEGGTPIEEEAFPSPPLDVGADRWLTAPCRGNPRGHDDDPSHDAANEDPYLLTIR